MLWAKGDESRQALVITATRPAAESSYRARSLPVFCLLRASACSRTSHEVARLRTRRVFARHAGTTASLTLTCAAASATVQLQGGAVDRSEMHHGLIWVNRRRNSAHGEWLLSV